jgi:hypothetical protein
LVTKVVHLENVEEPSDPWEGKPKDSWSNTVIDPERDFLTVTIKAGAGFEVPWLVFHTNSVTEALETLKHDDLDELMDLAARKGKDFARAFGGSQSFAKPAAAPAAGGWSKPAPQATSAPSGERPSGTCPVHNCDLTYVEPFTKRDGSTISARVACPVPKCYAKTFWHNKDGSWTEK